MSFWIMLVCSLQACGSLCEGGRRSEVRQNSAPMILKVWEVEAASAAGLWKLGRAGWALQEESCLDHLKSPQDSDNEHVFSHHL